MILIGDVYIDKDIRMFNRALRVVDITDKAICEIGHFDKFGLYHKFVGRHAKTKIALPRLADRLKFDLRVSADSVSVSF